MQDFTELNESEINDELKRIAQLTLVEGFDINEQATISSEMAEVIRHKGRASKLLKLSIRAIDPDFESRHRGIVED